MKKVILILAVAGIFILTLNSCARSCKGGMCPSWSQTKVKTTNSFEIAEFRFLEELLNYTERSPKYLGA